MSTFVHRLLDEHGSDVSDVASLGGTRSTESVFAATYHYVTGLGYDVRHTPNEMTPIGTAHASVRMSSGLARAESRALRTDLAILMRLVHGKITITPPEGS